RTSRGKRDRRGCPDQANFHPWLLGAAMSWPSGALPAVDLDMALCRKERRGVYPSRNVEYRAKRGVPLVRGRGLEGEKYRRGHEVRPLAGNQECGRGFPEGAVGVVHA